jgi:hypothetical protein
MWWYDTSTSLLKRRNNADDAWITVGLEAASTDGTFSANSDSLVPTQKAAKTYADTKVSKSTAAEIYNVTEKTTPASNDVLLLEDSAASYAKKSVKISNIRQSIDTILPTQTGNSGKYLTTNGSAASWGSVVQNTFKSASGIVELQNTTSISGLGFTPVSVHIFFSGPPAGTSGGFVLSSVSNTSYTIYPLGAHSPRTGVLTIKNKVSGGFDIDIQLSGSNGSILHRCYWVAYNE